jgi:hypothetical protein
VGAKEMKNLNVGRAKGGEGLSEEPPKSFGGNFPPSNILLPIDGDLLWKLNAM